MKISDVTSRTNDTKSWAPPGGCHVPKDRRASWLWRDPSSIDSIVLLLIPFLCLETHT